LHRGDGSDGAAMGSWPRLTAPGAAPTAVFPQVPPRPDCVRDPEGKEDRPHYQQGDTSPDVSCGKIGDRDNEEIDPHKVHERQYAYGDLVTRVGAVL
jgi:hypothetical protein